MLTRPMNILRNQPNYSICPILYAQKIISSHLPVCFNHFVKKCCLLISSAAYIQMHSRNYFIMEANTMNSDQTAKGAV